MVCAEAPSHRSSMTTRRVLATTAAVALAATSLLASSAAAVSYPQQRVSSKVAPYVAAIFYNAEPGTLDPSDSCSGSLIDSRHVLTAAHCVTGMDATQMLVGLDGSSKADMTLVGVMDFEVHLRYTEPLSNDEVGLPHDIALLRLSSPVTDVKPVALPGKKDASYRGSKKGMAIYGWGVDQNNASNDQLGFSKQNDYSTRARKWFPDFNSRYQLAAGRPLKSERLFSSACFGDSGGPLVGFGKKGQHVVLGVVSYGTQSCRTAAPTVYTRVSAYASWIAATKRLLASRQSSAELSYVLAGTPGGGEGTYASVANIQAGMVSATEESTSFSVRIAGYSAAYAYEYGAIFYRADADAPIAYATSGGLFRNSDDALLCASTAEVLGDSSAAALVLYVDSACLTGFFGGVFDVALVVSVTDAPVTAASASSAALGTSALIRAVSGATAAVNATGPVTTLPGPNGVGVKLDGSLSFSPAGSVSPGGVLTVLGSGLSAGVANFTLVSVANPAGVAIGTTTVVGADGVLNTKVTIPADTVAGTYYIRVIDATVRIFGGEVTVGAAGSPGSSTTPLPGTPTPKASGVDALFFENINVPVR